MKRLLALGLSAALLAGCGADATADRVERRADRRADRRACDGFGFQLGTDAHSNCMMQQAARRAERDERALDREAWDKPQRSR